eukprot:scaffold1220_cov259-Pinguiococcus_pyrenoidosus.AAC.39
MSSFVRQSKFRHVYCEPPKNAEDEWQGFRLATATGEQVLRAAFPPLPRALARRVWPLRPRVQMARRQRNEVESTGALQCALKVCSAERRNELSTLRKPKRTCVSSSAPARARSLRRVAW